LSNKKNVNKPLSASEWHESNIQPSFFVKIGQNVAR